MSQLTRLAAAVIGGALLYALTFLFVLQKPLTTGATKSYYAKKVSYIESISGARKIVVFAGSNGRFSHRCQTIEAETGMKCANISVAAGANLNWQLDKYLPSMHSGDILYLPLEYMTEPGALGTVGTESAYIVAYDRLALTRVYTPREAMSALFGFNIQDVFESMGEMALAAVGKQTRYSVRTLTPQGDESGHGLQQAAEYAAFVRQEGPPRPIAALYRSDREMAQVEEILRVAQAKGITVVGGLPTTVVGTDVGPDVIAAIRDFYVSRGACFVSLPNLSLYPVADFYDSNYHLAEPAQIRHSKLVAAALREIAEHGCPAKIVAGIGDRGNRE
jgi:hypothetical protein